MKWITNLFKNIVGPTTVMAAGTMGAGAVASFMLAGAWFRYDLLWVLLFMIPIFVIGVNSASRIGALNHEHGMFTLICQHVHPGFAWLLLVVNIPIHVLIIMGQMSVMTSSLMSLAGFYPPEVNASVQYVQGYHRAEIILSILCAAAILWLILSQGYERMQKAMGILMVSMFVCFLIVALRGFSEIVDILTGFIPQIPADLPIPGTDNTRVSTSSIISMAGSAIAPAALLGMPYLSTDARTDESTLKQDFRNSLLNLGLIFGAYAIFIVVAGAYALYPLENHAQIDTVHETSKILLRAFPESMSAIGPLIFSAGVFMAAMTTMIVAAQVSTYFCLDMFKKSWHYTPDNKPYHYLLILFVLMPAFLAPFWSFPALLKVVLLMGVNVIVIPLVFAIVLFMVNQTKVMGQHRAEWWRNMILLAGLVLSIVLAADKLPGYLQYLTS
ncbi:MAG: divalent metal cation transporter [Gammaproteobacteria bacterium]|nr:divalent metal cation transporter [Gammaproteobacteria bacterium]